MLFGKDGIRGIHWAPSPKGRERRHGFDAMFAVARFAVCKQSMHSPGGSWCANESSDAA